MTDELVQVDQLLAQVVDVGGADAELGKEGDDGCGHHRHRVDASPFRTKAPRQNDVCDA